MLPCENLSLGIRQQQPETHPLTTILCYRGSPVGHHETTFTPSQRETSRRILTAGVVHTVGTQHTDIVSVHYPYCTVHCNLSLQNALLDLAPKYPNSHGYAMRMANVDRLISFLSHTRPAQLLNYHIIFALEKSISGWAAMNFLSMSCLLCSSLVGSPMAFCL